MTSYRNIPPVVWVLLSMVLFELSGIMLVYTPLIIPTVFMLLSVLLFVYVIFSNMSGMKRSNIGLFSFFLIWNTILILRGSLIGNFNPGVHDFQGVIMNIIKNPYSGLPYLMPCIALWPVRLDSLYYFRKIGLTLCGLSFILFLINRNFLFSDSLVYGVTELTSSVGTNFSVRRLTDFFFLGLWLVMLLFFMFNYKKNGIAIVFVVYMTLHLILQITGGGRGGSVQDFLYLAAFFYLMYKYPISVNANKLMTGWTRFVTLVLLCGFCYGVVYLYNETSTFDFLLQRLFENGEVGGFNELKESSREYFTKMMVSDFNEHPLSWVFGRGVNGAYVCPTGGTEGMRQWQEWGFLYFILKGGVPYLVMYVFLFSHAAYVGFFRSRNLLCKAMAFICVFNLIGLATATIPGMEVHYIIVWYCFGMLENESVRNMDDSAIYGYFNIKKYRND